MPNVILKFQRWLRKQFVKPIIDALIVSLRDDADTWLFSESGFDGGLNLTHVTGRFYVHSDGGGYAQVRGMDGRIAIEMTSFERYVLGKAAQSWLTNYHHAMVNVINRAFRNSELQQLTPQ